MLERFGAGRCCCPNCVCETRGCVCNYNWGFTTEEGTAGTIPASRFLGHYVGLQDWFTSVEWSIMMWWDNCAPVQDQQGTLFALYDPGRAVLNPLASPAAEIFVEQSINQTTGQMTHTGTIQTYDNAGTRTNTFSMSLPTHLPYSDSTFATSCKMLGISYRRSPGNNQYNYLNMYYNDQDQFNTPTQPSAELYAFRDGDPSVDPIPLPANELWRPGGGTLSGSFLFNVGVARSDYPPAAGNGANQFNRLFDGCGSHLTIWHSYNTLADWQAEWNSGAGSNPPVKSPFEHWCPTEPAVCGTANEDSRNTQTGDNGRILRLMSYELDDNCEQVLDENGQPILGIA